MSLNEFVFPNDFDQKYWDTPFHSLSNRFCYTSVVIREGKKMAKRNPILSIFWYMLLS